MIKKICISVYLVLAATMAAFSQSADEKIGMMLNGSQWFELREFYETKTDSIMPFLDSFAKTMLGHFFNNPEQTLTYGADLLNNHSDEMGLGNVVSVGSIMSRAFYRMGEYGRAAELLESITQATSQYLDSATVTGLKSQIETYRSLAPYATYQVKKPLMAEIPFELKAVGKEGLQSYAMMFGKCRANGKDCIPQFDTGAGVNVISDSLCNLLGAKRLEANANVLGGGRQNGQLAIIDTLVLGDVVIRNVPFYVVSFKSGNEEADQYSKHTEMILGIELMNALQRFTIDFEKNMIDLHSDMPADAQTNLCFNSLSDIGVRCQVNGFPAQLTIDTGDASFGYLNSSALPGLDRFIPAEAEVLTRRMAGFGGVHVTSYRDIPDLSLQIADSTVQIPVMPYLKEADPASQASGNDGNIGIETFMLYKSVSFDMERMIMYPAK